MANIKITRTLLAIAYTLAMSSSVARGAAAPGRRPKGGGNPISEKNIDRFLQKIEKICENMTWKLN